MVIYNEATVKSDGQNGGQDAMEKAWSLVGLRKGHALPNVWLCAALRCTSGHPGDDNSCESCGQIYYNSSIQETGWQAGGSHSLVEK